ncbi:MAG: ABC transporter ATP-binding protein [Bacteroidales bacterium]
MKIEIDHISYAYKKEKVLDDVDLMMESGDLVTILGPNGSGKSTLLKCMVSILKVQEGEIRIDGKPQRMYDARALSQLIAYIPQSEVSAMELNVFDTILLGRKPYIGWNVTDNDLEVTEALMRSFQLEDLAFRSVATLSGGQRQRVYIARAMAQQPRILLLDEPAANLDIYHQLKVMELLKQLVQEGMIVILTEHDINMAARYATKVVMLRDGKVFDCGDSSVFSEENIRHLYDIHASIHCLQDQIFVIPENIIK